MNGILPDLSDMRLTRRGNKPNVRSRAYAKFRHIDALATFHRAFNGHTFTDSRGRSSRAVIEFAPFQKSVKGRIKPDARQGTIEASPEYKEFLDSPTEPTSSEPATLSVCEEPTTTPLIEYLRHQKAAKAEKERAQKEKVRLAKIAALQAKANEQSAKLRADKLAKVENIQSKGGENLKEGKQAGAPPSRGGRGGRGGGRGRDSQRAKPPPHQQPTAGKKPQTPQNITNSGKEPAVSASTGIATSPSTQLTSPKPSAQPAPVAADGNVVEAGVGGGNIENQGGSRGGGRGRGRRPYGVYRRGGGSRGGRGRGNSVGSNDSKGVTAVRDG